MDARIVNSQKEIDMIYYYPDKKGAPKGTKFPCILISEYNSGGIGGSSYSYRIETPPLFQNSDFIDGWIHGVKYALNCLSND